MDIQINTIYLIDAKTLGSKQCRYEIEAMGFLSDEPVIRERRDVTWGNHRSRLGLGLHDAVNRWYWKSIEVKALKPILVMSKAKLVLGHGLTGVEQ